MSTIIIPGGGCMGLGIASLAGNIIALIILIMIVKYFWKNVKLPEKPINVSEELLKYNVDVRGLFDKSSQKKETYVVNKVLTSADVFMEKSNLVEDHEDR